MAEPISVASGLASLVFNLSKIVKELVTLTEAYRNAPSSIQFLLAECYACNAAISQLQVILGEDGSRQNLACIHLDDLINIIKSCQDTTSELEIAVKKICSGNMPGIRAKTRFIWKTADFERLSKQLQNHKCSLNLMLTILNTNSDVELKETMNRMQLIMTQMATTQKKLWKTIQIAGNEPWKNGNGRKADSSVSSLYTAFAFDSEILTSKAYQNLNHSKISTDLKSLKTISNDVTLADISDVLRFSLPKSSDNSYSQNSTVSSHGREFITVPLKLETDQESAIKPTIVPDIDVSPDPGDLVSTPYAPSPAPRLVTNDDADGYETTGDRENGKLPETKKAAEIPIPTTSPEGSMMHGNLSKFSFPLSPIQKKQPNLSPTSPPSDMYRQPREGKVSSPTLREHKRSKSSTALGKRGPVIISKPQFVECSLGWYET